ncbi:MAG: EamA family transporter [Proteobacteria bacterium]|nr:EamA family transporter [Pseudomonadota bacterium]
MNNAVLYGFTVLIWGTTWFAIKLQLGVVAPEASIVYRFALAALILLGWCAARRLRIRFNAREHGFAALLGLLLFSLNYVLFYIATESVTSGLVAVSFSLMILFNVLFGALCLGSAVRPRVVAGGLVGVVGIALIYWPELAGVGGGHATVAGLALCVLGTLSASLGNIVSARNQLAGLPVVPINAVAMAYGALFMAVLAAVGGRPFTFDWSVAYVGSLLHLAFFGSVIAFGCYLTLLGRIGADRGAYVNILHPIVALLVSTSLEGFRWTWPALVGVALVLAGNYFALSRGRGRGHARAAD